jgi:hypothetical protein
LKRSGVWLTLALAAQVRPHTRLKGIAPFS